jgi:hypothetical protein
MSDHDDDCHHGPIIGVHSDAYNVEREARAEERQALRESGFVACEDRAREEQRRPPVLKDLLNAAEHIVGLIQDLRDQGTANPTETELLQTCHDSAQRIVVGVRVYLYPSRSGDGPDDEGHGERKGRR